MTEEDEEPSIEELCKPLSAKVMPKTAKWNVGGREMTENRMLNSQRSAVLHRARKTRKRKRKKQDE